jgi:hypothetical protein
MMIYFPVLKMRIKKQICGQGNSNNDLLRRVIKKRENPRG